MAWTILVEGHHLQNYMEIGPVVSDKKIFLSGIIFWSYGPLKMLALSKKKIEKTKKQKQKRKKTYVMALGKFWHFEKS